MVRCRHGACIVVLTGQIASCDDMKASSIRAPVQCICSAFLIPSILLTLLAYLNDPRPTARSQKPIHRICTSVKEPARDEAKASPRPPAKHNTQLHQTPLTTHHYKTCTYQPCLLAD